MLLLNNIFLKPKAIMRVIFVIAFCCFTTLTHAQKLLESRQSSHYTYIFKITNKEAEKIYYAKQTQIDKSFFHSVIDSFPTGEQFEEKLVHGHYLKTYSDKNIQKIEITTVQNIDVFLLNNYQDLVIQLNDLNGEIVNSAKVKIKNRSIKYNDEIKAYSLRKSNRRGLLQVTYDGTTAFYYLDRNYNNSAFRRVSRKVLYGTPLRHVWTPIEFAAKVPIDAVKSISDGWSQGTIRRAERFFIRTYERVACIFDDYYCKNYKRRYYDNYLGYLVFNKPKYKPNDTVKFKSFIANKRGKPIDKPLTVFLQGNQQKIKITTLNPYDKGGYEFNFFLHDSLRLRLDTHYTIYLEDSEENNVMSGHFRYEDYELAKNNLQLRLPQKDHYKNKPLEIYLKGTDENDLVLQDARVQVLMRLKTPLKYYEDKLFIHDTLGFIERKLEPLSETKIEISDSLFPPANFEYELLVKLLTTDNELISKTENVIYYHKSEKLDAELVKDSIKFLYRKNGLSYNRNIQVYGKDNFQNKTLIFEGETPVQLKLIPFYSSYTTQSGDLEMEYNISNKPSLIQVSASRTKDSIKLEIYNPRNLFFNYNTYLKNNLISSGFTNELTISEPLNSLQNYQISIQYIWGGVVKNEEITIPLNDKSLNIEVNQPNLIYPGQQSIIELTVTDYEGNPVEGVDLTAYSMTKKFNYNPPALPYLGKNRKNRTIINTFSLNKEKLKSPMESSIDYEYWNSLAGLDSVEYYKFLYPKNEIYQFAYTPKDSLTQFAPFVFSDGEMLPIHVIYVDNKPVYFSWSTNERPYSFNVREGYHQIKLRTTEKIITIDSLFFPENKKLIFSIDESISKKGIDIKEVQNELNDQEQRSLYNYIFPYRNNFNNRFAYIQNDDNVQLLSPNYRHISNPLVGPISGTVVFRTLDGTTNVFSHEPYFEYDFQPDLLKMRTYDRSRLPKKLYSYNRNIRIHDLVLTPEKINEFYQNSIQSSRTTIHYFPNPGNTVSGFGRLFIEIDDEENLEEPPINILIFSNDDPDFVRVYPGNSRLIHQLSETTYRLIFFYPNKKYHAVDSITILSDGLNFLRIKKPDELMSDGFSSTIDEIIRNAIITKETDDKSNRGDLNRINIAHQQQYFYGESVIRVEGTIIDDIGIPLPGVNIIVRGTTIGTQTDFDGNYSILINAGDVLVFSYVGFTSQEILPRENFLNVQLVTSANHLEQVIVTGYSVSRQRSALGYAVESTSLERTLAGKTSGVMINSGLVGSQPQVTIRGLNSISSDNEPLYIVNGKVFTGDVAQLRSDQIISINVLNVETALNLYGAMGVNGVVIIELNDKELLSTLELQDKGVDFDDTFYESALAGGSLRKDFSDYAFWQPKLITDSEGKASFETIFPDDVTNWETFYLAMNGNKQSGKVRKSIKSYKPLMAQLAVPRFLVENDTTYAIGKTLNYTPVEQEVTITYEVNDVVQFSKKELFENAIIDTLMITAKDSISVKYIIEKADGYFDGELREIPVYPKGLYQTFGNFYVLDKNETIDLSFNPDYGKVKLYARADILEVLDEEMNHVIRYRYLCNEQVASKLKMLLMQKKLAAYKNVPFKKEKDIDKLISLLLKNQKSSGVWGWWRDSQNSYWISLQVLETLALAKDDGYTFVLNITSTTQDMIWRLENTSDFDETYRILKALKLLDAKVDYKNYIEKLEEKEKINFNERLKLTELQQAHGMNYQLDSIINNKRTTLFGNIYFADDKRILNLLNNNIQNTILAYKILKADTLDFSAELSKMRNYFFKRRNSGFWRNTYESAQIVETIIDDFIQGDSKPETPKLILEGDISSVIETFPFEMTVDPNQKISISKTGDFPVYFTSYQSFWESKPTENKGVFEISTQFGTNNRSVLKGGEEVTLFVKVKIEKDAEYVMINVPIPGGCSYGDNRNKGRFESHRENFKNETAIFCEKLPTGEHTFEIKLIPRYSGSYTLNPAKVELMYFPTFNANNTLEKIRIE